jgi:hypothetical protein
VGGTKAAAVPMRAAVVMAATVRMVGRGWVELVGLFWGVDDGGLDRGR